MSNEAKLRAQREFEMLEPLAHAAAARCGYLVDVGFVGQGSDFTVHVSAARVHWRLRKKYFLPHGDGHYLLRHQRPGYAEVQHDLGSLEAAVALLLEMGA